MRSPLLVVSAALLLVSATAVRADDAPAAAAAAESGVVFEPGTPAFKDVLAKAAEQKKEIFIDFSTDWCGWCRRLEKDTFSQAAVAEAMKGFVCIHVDAEKGEGPELAKRFNVHGFPTLVVTFANGDEVDRIVGYLPPGPFVKEITRIAEGMGTLWTLGEIYGQEPDDLRAGLAYGAKLAVARPAEAAALYGELLGKTKDPEMQATIRLEHAAALLETGDAEGAAKEAETLAKELPRTSAMGDAAERVGQAFVGLEPRRALAFVDACRAAAKDTVALTVIERLALRIHKNGVAEALKRLGEAAGDDAQALNEAAWACFEEKVNVREAIGWARKAAATTSRDPAVLDTLANLLWIAGAQDEAIKTETEAAEKSEGGQKKQFAAIVEKWRKEQAEMKAAGAVPMTPLQAPAAK